MAKKERAIPKRLSDLRDDLTPMQVKFAETLVHGENIKSATQCAIEAGYSEKVARVMASKLQNGRDFPKVSKYISELRDDLYNVYKISKSSFYRRMHTLGMKAEEDGNIGKAIEAEKERGKVAGLYNHTKTVNVGSIDRMNLEQVSQLLDSLQQQVIIDVTPDKEESDASETIQSNDQSEESDNQVS